MGGGSTTRRLAVDPIGSFSEQTKGALRSLQQEMAELNHTFQAAYPGRKTMQETRRGEGGQVSAHRASREEGREREEGRHAQESRGAR